MPLSVEFKLRLRTDFGTSAVVVGSAPWLGAWDIARAVKLHWSAGDVWKTVITYAPSHAAPARVEFKFAVVRDDSADLVAWEPAPFNHAASLPAVLPDMLFPGPVVVDAIWGASAELDLRNPSQFGAQSPPPTPAPPKPPTSAAAAVSTSPRKAIAVSAASDAPERSNELQQAVAKLAGERAAPVPAPTPNGIPRVPAPDASAASSGGSGARPRAPSTPELVPVQFRIKYRVADGERIYIIGNIPELGDWQKVHAPRLAQPVSDQVPPENGLWVLDMHIPRDKSHTEFEYKYFTRKNDGSRRWEGGGNRVARPFDDTASGPSGRVVWDDRWEKVRLEFSIYYPTKETEVMNVTGDPPEIGGWFKPGPTPMKLGPVQKLETDVTGRKWHLSVWVDPDLSSFPYRYIIKDAQSERSLWEREPNRKWTFDLDEPIVNSVHILRDVNFVSKMMFDKVPPNMFIGPYPQTVDDIDTLAEAGVTAVFNTQTDEDFEHRGIQWDLLMERYRKHDVTVVRYPIKDFDRISLRARLENAADELEELIRSGKQVYIHCTAGMGRAPACAVSYLCLKKGMELDAAVKHVKKHRIVAVPNVPVLTEVLKQARGRQSSAT